MAAGLFLSIAVLWLEIELTLPIELAHELNVQLIAGNVDSAFALVADYKERILPNSDTADEYSPPGMLEGILTPAIQKLELYALTIYDFLAIVTQWYQLHGSQLELSDRKRTGADYSYIEEARIFLVH